MKQKAIAAVIAIMMCGAPSFAFAHAGHDHGVKTKKVKKIKAPKKTSDTVRWIVRAA